MNKIAIGLVSFAGGCIFSAYKVMKLCEKAIKGEEQLVEKNSINFRITYKWLKGYQDGKKVTDYLEKKKINEVAIYGMGELGKLLLKELGHTNISVKYVIDRKNYKVFGSYVCCSLASDLPDVQAIIITPVSDFENIAGQLRKKTGACLISLNEIIDEL